MSARCWRRRPQLNRARVRALGLEDRRRTRAAAAKTQCVEWVIRGSYKQHRRIDRGADERGRSPLWVRPELLQGQRCLRQRLGQPDAHAASSAGGQWPLDTKSDVDNHLCAGGCWERLIPFILFGHESRVAAHTQPQPLVCGAAELKRVCALMRPHAGRLNIPHSAAVGTYAGRFPPASPASTLQQPAVPCRRLQQQRRPRQAGQRPKEDNSTRRQPRG